MNINVYYLGLLLHNNGSFSGLPTAFFLGMTIPPRKNQPQRSGRAIRRQTLFSSRLGPLVLISVVEKHVVMFHQCQKNTIDDVFASGPKTVLVKSTCLLRACSEVTKGWGWGGGMLTFLVLSSLHVATLHRWSGSVASLYTLSKWFAVLEGRHMCCYCACRMS